MIQDKVKVIEVLFDHAFRWDTDTCVYCKCGAELPITIPKEFAEDPDKVVAIADTAMAVHQAEKLDEL